MIVPFVWFDFVSGLQEDLRHGATFEQRLVAFRDGLSADVHEELLTFFRHAAMASEEDCRVLESPEMGQTLHMSFKRDKSGRHFYVEVLAVFEQGAQRPRR